MSEMSVDRVDGAGDRTNGSGTDIVVDSRADVIGSWLDSSSDVSMLEHLTGWEVGVCVYNDVYVYMLQVCKMLRLNWEYLKVWLGLG